MFFYRYFFVILILLTCNNNNLYAKTVDKNNNSTISVITLISSAILLKSFKFIANDIQEKDNKYIKVIRHNKMIRDNFYEYDRQHKKVLLLLKKYQD